MVASAERLSSQSGIGPLVSKAGIAKAHRITADLLRRPLAREAEHGSGIHATAQQNSNRNVRNHVEFYGFGQEIQQLLLGLLKRWIYGRLLEG